MSTLHLGAGSEKPAEVKGQARLYNMKFCPFSHRIRLILSWKKIPHDIVNINLKNKPEWYLQIHPEGQVPVFVDADGKIVKDSITIANYLEDKYPEPRLYREETKARDLELLKEYARITSIFSDCIHDKDKRPLDEIVADMSTVLAIFEKELETRETSFFGGNQPGMLDVLMWPWMERVNCIPLIHKQPVNFGKENFPHIMKWIREMKAQPFVQENAGSYEKFAEFIEDLRAGKADFDKE